MTPHEYQIETRRTRPAGEPRERALAHYALGLCEEAGELAGVIKKHVFYGHPLDRDKLIKEAGDVLWYLASLLDTAGIALSEALAANGYTHTVQCIDAEEYGEDGADFHARNVVACAAYSPKLMVNPAFREDAVALAGRLLAHLYGLLSLFDITLDEVMVANVAKLRARYPQGWTAADAAERKDERA